MSDEASRLVYRIGDEARSVQGLRNGAFVVHGPRPVRPSEAFLIDSLPGKLGPRVLVSGSREGLTAAALAALSPANRVEDHHDDCHLAERARKSLALNGLDERARVHCSADLPEVEGGHDAVILVFRRDGDSGLAADLIEQSIRLLRRDGLLVAVVDAPRDRFLADRISRSIGGLTRVVDEGERGLMIVARRPERISPYRPARFPSYQVPVGAGSIAIRTRPGIFAGGRLDGGARALLAGLRIRPGDRVLDLGSGPGVLGIAAARLGAGSVLLADSSARAIACCEENVAANAGPATAPIEVRHSADLRGELGAGSFDLVLANPPYYSSHRISEIFLQIAHELLAPGGRLLLVTRQEEWHRQRIGEMFRQPVESRRGGYVVFEAER